MSWKEIGSLLGNWILNPKCNFYKSSCLVKWTKDLFKNHVDFLAAVYKFTGKDILFPRAASPSLQATIVESVFVYPHMSCSCIQHPRPYPYSIWVASVPSARKISTQKWKPHLGPSVFSIKECHVF